MSDLLIFPAERVMQAVTEDTLIKTYVPEAENLSHEEALKLAMERDRLAAEELEESAKSSLKLSSGGAYHNSPRVNKLLKELGF